MGCRIVIVLADSTTLNIESGKLEQFFLKHPTFLGRQLGHEHLMRIRRIPGIGTLVLHFPDAFLEIVRCNVQCAAQIQRIQILNFLHHHGHIVCRLVIDQQVSVAVIHHPTARILGFIEESIAVRILFIVLAHNLKRKKAYQENQHNQYDRPSQHILPLLQIKISFHLPLASY